MGCGPLSQPETDVHGRLTFTLGLSRRRKNPRTVLRFLGPSGLSLTLRSFAYVSYGVTLSSTDVPDTPYYPITPTSSPGFAALHRLTDTHPPPPPLSGALAAIYTGLRSSEMGLNNHPVRGGCCTGEGAGYG